MNKIILGISAACILSMGLYSCGGGKKPVNPANVPVPVNLYTTQLEKVTYYDQIPGTVVALSQVDLHPEVEGYITGIFFKEGDHVTKGQKLYEIDESKYQASYNQAQSGVRVAQANVDQSQKDADRYTYLNQHDAIAKQILDHAVTTLQNSKSQLSSAKQDLIKAQTDLNYAIIRAPFDGTIGLSQVKLGNTVSVGQTTLNTISTDNPMAVDFVVNEKQLPRFIRLQRAGYNPADSMFQILLPDGTAYNAQGQISVIDRGVDPQTGTVRIRLVFPNNDFFLRAGMSCTVKVRNEDKDPQIVIPNQAIVEQMGEYFVFVAKDTIIHTDTSNSKKSHAADTATLRAIQKKVALGQAIDANVIVKSGLQPGEKVVTDGLQKLHEGTPITTSNKPPAGAQGGKGGQQSSGGTSSH